MEFGDTEAYRVSKEAQKMQSEVKTRVCVCVCVCVCVFTPSESLFLLSAGRSWNQSFTHI